LRLYAAINIVYILVHSYYTHTTILWLCGFCPGQPGWAGTRRNKKHSPTHTHRGHQSSLVHSY